MADRFADYSRAPTGNGVESLTLNVGGGDHVPTDLPNGFHCNAAGNLVGRLANDTADRTFALLAGCLYPYRFALVRQSGTTATGIFLYTR